MKWRSIGRLSLHLLLLLGLLIIESTMGLPWLSIFFIQQIIIRSSTLSAWVITISLSFLLSTAFANSLLLVFGLLVFLWLYQNIRSVSWWLVYLLTVLVIGYPSLVHFSWLVVGQSFLSLGLLLIYTKGIIWWPKIWKNNEKIV